MTVVNALLGNGHAGQRRHRHAEGSLLAALQRQCSGSFFMKNRCVASVVHHTEQLEIKRLVHLISESVYFMNPC